MSSISTVSREVILSQRPGGAYRDQKLSRGTFLDAVADDNSISRCFSDFFQRFYALEKIFSSYNS